MQQTTNFDRRHWLSAQKVKFFQTWCICCCLSPRYSSLRRIRQCLWSLPLKMDEKGLNFRCGPCEVDGKQDENVVRFCVDCDQHLCEECWRYHSRIKELKTHQCVRLDEVKRTRKGHDKEDDIPAQPDENPKRCSRHPVAVKEYYCIDCNESGCGECMSERHKSCRIVRFPDFSRFLSRAKEAESPDFDFNELRKELAVMKESISRVETEMDKNIKDIRKKEKEISSEIDALDDDTSEFIQMFLQMLGKESDDIIEAEKDHYDKVTSKLREIEKSIEIIKPRKDRIRDSCVYHVMDEVNRVLLSFNGRSDMYKKRSLLVLMEQLETFIRSVHRFKTDMEHGGSQDPLFPTTDFDDPNDAKKCHISGALVTGTRLIFADCNNKKVKVFDIDNEKVIAELHLPALFRES